MTVIHRNSFVATKCVFGVKISHTSAGKAYSAPTDSIGEGGMEGEGKGEVGVGARGRGSGGKGGGRGITSILLLFFPTLSCDCN